MFEVYQCALGIATVLPYDGRMDDDELRRVMSELGKRSAARLTPEQRSERARRAAAARRQLSAEELRARALLGVEARRRKRSI